jgi:hypothetical protein
MRLRFKGDAASVGNGSEKSKKGSELRKRFLCREC